MFSLLRKHSTAQRSQPAHAAQQVRADQSATTQASRQSWLEPACRSASIQLAVLKTNEEIEMLPGLLEYTTIHQQLISSCDVPCTIHYYFSPSFLFRAWVRRPGCCIREPWSYWHLQLSCRQFAPKTTDLSFRFIRSHLFIETYVLRSRLLHASEDRHPRYILPHLSARLSLQLPAIVLFVGEPS